MLPKCHCGECGWPTAHGWYLCEWGHEFYSKPRPRPDAITPLHIDPTVIAESMPYVNYIHTGTNKPSPYVLYSAA